MLGALEVNVQVVLPGEGDAAVGLEAAIGDVAVGRGRGVAGNGDGRVRIRAFRV